MAQGTETISITINAGNHKILWIKIELVDTNSRSRSCIDSVNGLLYIYFNQPNTTPVKRLWVSERLQSMIMANHHGSTLGGHWREEKTYEAIAITVMCKKV